MIRGPVSLPPHRPPEPQEWVALLVAEVGDRCGGLVVQWAGLGHQDEDWRAFLVYRFDEDIYSNCGELLGAFRLYSAGRDYALATLCRTIEGERHCWLFKDLRDALLWAIKPFDAQINEIEPLAYIAPVARVQRGEE